MHAFVTLVNFRAGFLVFLFAYATYPRFFAVGIGGAGFALTGQRIMLVSLAGVFLLRLLYGTRDAVAGMNAFLQERALLLGFLGLLLSRLAGNLLTGRVDVAVIVTFVDEAMYTLFIALLALTCITTRKHLYTVLTVIVLSMFPNEIAAIIEAFIQRPIFPASLTLDFETARDATGIVAGAARFGFYRAMGFFDSSLKLMAVAICILPVAIHLVQRANTQFKQRLIIFIAFMIPVVVLLTGSRTGIMVLILMTAFYGYQFVRRRFGPLDAFLLMTVMVIVGAGLLFFLADDIISNFLFGKVGGRSTTSRVLQYAFSWPLLLESPWLGYGYARNFVDVIDINRIDGYYLRIAMEGGVVALTCLFFIFWRAIRTLSLLEKLGDPGAAYALKLSLYMLAIMMLALNMGASNFYVYLYAAIAVALKRIVLAEHAAGQLATEPRTADAVG